MPDRNFFPGAALGCMIALALPSTALAAAPSITGPASTPEGTSPAAYTITCGDEASLIPAPLPGSAPIPDVGTLTVTVTPGPAPAATKDADYSDPQAISTTVACPAGGAVSVPILDDGTDEPNEKFTVRITGSLVAVGSANPAPKEIDQSVVTTIVDDDVPSASLVELVRVLEGDSGVTNVDLAVSLSQIPAEAATIAYATEGSSALAGSDFTAAAGQLVIPAGQQAGTITVPIVGDTVVEKVEALYLNLTGAEGATLNPSRSQAGIAVFDNDKPPVPSVSVVKGVTIREGNAGTVNALFAVTLSHAAAERTQVAWRTANFSANLADYAKGGGTLVFQAGQRSKTISVVVKGDSRDEPNEAFGVILDRPAGATIANRSGFGIITDDDGPKVTIAKPKVTRRALVTRLACPASADRCTGRLVATAGRLKVGAARFALAKGTTGKVTLKLSRRARASLREGALRVKLAATAADASGAKRTVTRTVRLRRVR